MYEFFPYIVLCLVEISLSLISCEFSESVFSNFIDCYVYLLIYLFDRSIYDKVQLTMRFPNSPKLKTLVSNTQQKERKNTAGTSRNAVLPKLKEKPSVVVN